MTANSLQCYTIVFPDPQFTTAEIEYSRINGTISFTFLSSFDITTLSTSSAEPGNDIQGLLYVPDLDPSEPCYIASEPFVPPNVTRQEDLPAGDYDHVAIAPWVSANCTLKYLASAQQELTRSFLFFLPGNDTGHPPGPNAPVWNLSDGNRWKSESQYPIYAIPGPQGEQLMHASAQYSKNMTDVPHGHELTETYDPTDYVRLFVNIGTSGGDDLPSLWVFLLVVLGILLAVIGSTSVAMHWLQRRRRQSLRRRVASGEVDLEALGIKRLTVPQDVLDTLPLYTYGTGTPAKRTSDGEILPSESQPADTHLAPPTQIALAAPNSNAYCPSPLQQPTCAICLDDFVPGAIHTRGTVVRELPCRHIFHPECVDAFLRDSSSLCPMCKKTALPTGYCPRVITNAMVRRERMVRRVQPQQEIDPSNEDSAEDAPAAMRLSTRLRSAPTRTFSGLAQLGQSAGRRFSSAPLSPLPRSWSQQMTQLPSSPSPVLPRSASSSNLPQHDTATATSSVTVQPSSNPRRTEWARQRAVAMLGRRTAPIDPDAEEDRSLPRWRKAFRGLFPVVAR